MSAAPVPSRFEDLTAEWMNLVLDVQPGVVERIDVEPLGPGVGFLGDVARVRVRYRPGHQSGPASVMVKIPPADPGGRQVGSMLNVWAREQAFYREVAPSSPGAQVPICHHTGADPDQGRWVLVLEDCPSEPLDAAVGASDEQAMAAVDALVGFHAHWWQAERILEWMPGLDRTSFAGLSGAWSEATPLFLDRYGHLLPDGTEEWLRACPSWLPDWSARAGREPVTIVHADYRLDNLRYHDGRMTIIDWQTALRGPGAMDLSSFVVTGCTIERRRRLEPDLLDRYARGLAAAGVTVDPAWLGQSYDENLLWWMGQFASNLARLEPDDAGAQAALDTMIERTFTAAADRDVGRLLASS